MDKIRREKDIISRTVDKYIQTTTKDYAKYFEGSSPTYVIYYQLDTLATKQDSSLENVHSLTGPNSPNKYKKIEDVVVYGVDPMDITNEINEKGLQSIINGEFLILPDTLKPYPGDFFVFDYEGLRDHLFRIDNVQFDKASPRKYFRISYAIYPDNTELIFDNIEDTYVLNYENIGGEEAAVIKKADAIDAEKAKTIVDGLITKFSDLFYDEDMDSFVFNTTNYETSNVLNIWSPALQKFLHNNKVLTSYSKELLTEFYINDILEADNTFFSEAAYRKSIFRKVETQDKRLTLDNSFMSVVLNPIPEYDLKSTRNLQFFHSVIDYKMADVFNTNAFYFDAFHILEQNYDQTISRHPSSLIFTNSADIGDAVLNTGDIVYLIPEPLVPVPTDVFKVLTEAVISIGFNFLIKTDAELMTFFTSQGYTEEDAADTLEIVNKYIEDHLLFSIIKSYLLDELTLDTDLLLALNNYYYDNSFQTYILLPIVIYILKKKITETGI